MARHPSLYFTDGSLTIKAMDGSKTLYNVYRGSLAEQSVLFAGMLSLPNPTIPAIGITENSKKWFENAIKLGLAGTTDENAIEIPAQFKAAEIEVFLEFIWSNPKPDLATACGILKISHFLICSVGIAYARHHLDDNSELGPVQRMSLGFNYFFADWITKAFDELMGVTINDISEEDERIMGWPAYRALAKVQAKVLDARLNLALDRIPDVNHCNWCNNLGYCKGEWAKMWTSSEGILGALLKDELSGAEVMEKLSSYPRGGMNVECHMRTCAGLQDTAEKVSIFREEEGLVDAAVEELLRSAGIPSAL
ncbi:hypothetical protein C8F04DRAFT_1192316 [Mycena alexandri]|uniref:BTB domain-containing protein n=1 Tax=Mycena alexandri TaxID=1745969 RepID=A0AAD6SAX4_9AGAR|nr:hypothetical protein C8F04DRAFT_1192316 [Mycena alexandri]